MRQFNLTSSRITALREAVLNKTPSACIERARYLTEGYQEFAAYPLYIQRAQAVAKVLRNMSIYIKEGELIVGNQASDERTAPIFPEYASQWMIEELAAKGNFNHREGDNFYLDPVHHAELIEICNWWQGKTLSDKCKAAMPEAVKTASEIKVIHGEGNMTSGDGHIVPDFEKVLQFGLLGINEQVRDRINQIEISDDDGLRQRAFLESIIILNDAIIDFALRYAEIATSLAAQSNDEKRALELRAIAERCRQVPANPPRDFAEALQLVWFIHLVIQIESNGHSASLGRMDQYLYPYFAKDSDSGILSKEFAKELLECFYIKLYSILKIRPTSHAGYGAGYPTYQNITISGMNWDGSDATNELSYLILETVGEAKLTQPNLSARVHTKSPEKFLRMCGEVIITGYGMPALHNDEIIIPALMHKGVTYQDAYNYTQVGCVEVAVPGKWGYRCTGMSFLNFIKAVELTLNDGIDPRTGKVTLTGNGKLTDFASYGELWSAWKKHIVHYTKLTVALDKLADTHLEQFPDILCSALVDDCIGRAKTVKEGGAIYDIIAGLQVGLANAANSFAALKQVVYEEKQYTLAEVFTALNNNFADDQGKMIQYALLSAPKFGNDDDYVDSIAREVYDCYIEEINKHHNTRYGKGPIGGGYSLSTSGISSNVPMGVVTGATPDGRSAYMPAAEGVSPTQGSDKKGPTAVLNSVMKLPTILFTGGQLLNQKFLPSLVQDPVRFEKFIDFIRTFVDMKGWHVQFNIISAETLKAAQQNPEKYRDVIVRVAGYCAQFVTLDQTTQNDIISRTEQNL